MGEVLFPPAHLPAQNADWPIGDDDRWGITYFQNARPGVAGLKLQRFCRKTDYSFSL